MVYTRPEKSLSRSSGDRTRVAIGPSEESHEPFGVFLFFFFWGGAGYRGFGFGDWGLGIRVHRDFALGIGV